MKTLSLVIVIFLLAGCSSKHDQVQEAAVSNPIVTPPAGPICSQSPWSNEGETGGRPPRVMKVTIPNFDLSKGDTVLFYYKQWDKTEWAPFREGYYSPITFSVSGSVVTITNTVGAQHDWRIDAMIWSCN